MIEMIVGLFLFAVLMLHLIQFLIRLHCRKVKQRRMIALAEYKTRREEVELKARRQL